MKISGQLVLELDNGEVWDVEVPGLLVDETRHPSLNDDPDGDDPEDFLFGHKALRVPHEARRLRISLPVHVQQRDTYYVCVRRDS